MPDFRDMEIAVGDARFAVRDYGGYGPGMLLVHGTGHNAAVWTPLARLLRDHFRVWAFDLRGQGQTPATSDTAEQYWRDIGPLSVALGLDHPLLVGHSAGGYAVTAFAATGGACRAVVTIDGFTPSSRECVQRDTAAMDMAVTEAKLADMFRYGWRADTAERDAYIAALCEEPGPLGLNVGIDPSLIAAFAERAFRRQPDGTWMRRPDLPEISRVSRPEPAGVYPCVEHYDLVRVPMLLIFAVAGLYRQHRAVIEGVAESGVERRFVAIDGNHNLHMAKPRDVADAILDFARDRRYLNTNFLRAAAGEDPHDA